MSQLPSSFGGFHSSATLKPQLSTNFRASGGPGRSTDRSHVNRSQQRAFLPIWSGVLRYSPTTCSKTLAVSSTFSICTCRSYCPECFLSVLRMKRIESTSLFLTLTNEESRGFPSLLQITFGLGLPCTPKKGRL